MNFALLLFSPILLVRILDPNSFGQYREFMAYSMLVAGLAAFAIKSNLLYFVPHNPENTCRYISHTNWLTFVTSILACVALWIFRDVIQANTSFDFLAPLAIYVLLFINLTFLESYWIATKRPKNVFYYSTIRTIVRLTAVIGAAYVTRSVEVLLNTLIATEVVRVAVVLLVTQRLKLLSFRIDWKILKTQLAFVIPFGFATSLTHLNQYIGQVAISTQLGVVALATYVVASYQVPIINIVRSSIGDAIFPDMVRQAALTEGDNLRLWKRSNIAYSFLIVPTFVLLLWYADILIPLVFTDQYVAAVPIYRILLLVMLIQCFEFSSPLRAVSRNTLLLTGNLLMLCANVAIIFTVFRFFETYAIFGPAIALVVGYILQLTFFGWSITRVFRIPVAQLLKWRSLMIIFLCSATSCLVLVSGEILNIPDLVRLPIFSLAFLGVYYVTLHQARIEEVEIILAKLRSRLRRN